MKPFVTTLSAIRAHSPCTDGWRKLLTSLGKTDADDEPLDLLTILDSNGIDDAIWCLRALPSNHDPMIRLLACDFAETVLKCTSDPRPAEAIRVARAYARGEASVDELAAARGAAWAAADAAADAAAARVASCAARDAAMTVITVGITAIDAAWVATWAATWDAMGTWESSFGIAMIAAREEQAAIFRAFVANARVTHVTDE